MFRKLTEFVILALTVLVLSTQSVAAQAKPKKLKSEIQVGTATATCLMRWGCEPQGLATLKANNNVIININKLESVKHCKTFQFTESLDFAPNDPLAKNGIVIFTDQNGYDIGGFRNLTGKSVTHVDRSFTQDSLPGLLNGKTATLHIVSGNGTKIGGNHFTLTGVSASITCN